MYLHNDKVMNVKIETSLYDGIEKSFFIISYSSSVNPCAIYSSSEAAIGTA